MKFKDILSNVSANYSVDKIWKEYITLALNFEFIFDFLIILKFNSYNNVAWELSSQNKT